MTTITPDDDEFNYDPFDRPAKPDWFSFLGAGSDPQPEIYEECEGEESMTGTVDMETAQQMFGLDEAGTQRLNLMFGLKGLFFPNATVGFDQLMLGARYITYGEACLGEARADQTTYDQTVQLNRFDMEDMEAGSVVHARNDDTYYVLGLDDKWRSVFQDASDGSFVMSGPNSLDDFFERDVDEDFPLPELYYAGTYKQFGLTDADLRKTKPSIDGQP